MSDADPNLDAPPWDDDALGDDTGGEAPERDPNTDDMFGAPPEPKPEPRPEARVEAETETAPEPVAKPVSEAKVAAVTPKVAAVSDDPAYTVLARKYRPRTFEDLIGQEAMVRTLANSFATGRIAQAWMLTGVRGVGKTTTARLLARALNNETDTIDKPSLALTPDGRHDAAIMAGQHMDVQEMDAASHTGVGDIRELIESVRYAPVEARYKVYVLDEVHMLSTAAFNALLKTLEEPPPHAKFIFATTEIRKVPVTILSRCQRFDLRRVEPDVLSTHLGQVAAQEGMSIDDEALALISRAAEGSVRDGLSLLDQALVQAEAGQQVKAEIVRDMLGLADRTQSIALFEAIMGGRTPEALEMFRALYGFGADPVQLVGDLLEHCHAASVAKMLGAEATRLPADQAKALAALGAAVPASNLSRAWQMLLKALEETRRAPRPSDAVEMAIVRLAYAADLPGPEEALKALREGEPILPGGPAGTPGPRGGGGGGATSAVQTVASAPQARPADPQTFEQVVALIGDRREISLQLDVKAYVKVVEFQPGRITYEPAPGAPAGLPQRLSARLKEWTGRPWFIVANGQGGAETLMEADRKKAQAVRAEVEADPLVQSILKAFPGAKLGEIKEPPPMVELPAIPDEGEGEEGTD